MKIKCLIVDDEPAAIRVVENYLQELKHIEIAGKCNSAIEAIEFLSDYKIDLIFLDINMPIVDGFVFLYEFEKFNSVLRNKCKVIILSSSDNKRDIDKIVNNDNVIKFITKPLTENALEEIKSIG